MIYPNVVNLSSLSDDAFKTLYNLDKSWIGSTNYMGVAYFWNWEYRHFLRDTTTPKRRRVHKKLLKAGLELSGVSDAHLSIIRSIVKE